MEKLEQLAQRVLDAAKEQQPHLAFGRNERHGVEEVVHALDVAYLPGEGDDNFLTWGALAPDGDSLAALEDHVVAENVR